MVTCFLDLKYLTLFRIELNIQARFVLIHVRCLDLLGVCLLLQVRLLLSSPKKE